MPETSPCQTVIRAAGPADADLILQFIRDLADYEKLRHEVVATRDLIDQYLFGERRYAEVVIAEWQGSAAGFALFFPNFSTFLGRPGIYLEDLYVKPEHRGHGVGMALLSHLAALTVERGFGRLDWSVLDWNEPAIGFYRRLGARGLDDWTQFRLEGSALNTLANKTGKPD